MRGKKKKTFFGNARGRFVCDVRKYRKTSVVVFSPVRFGTNYEGCGPREAYDEHFCNDRNVTEIAGKRFLFQT